MAGGEKNFAGPINLHKNELREAVLQNLASAPSAPLNGQAYYDTALNAVGLRINGAWFYISTEHFQDLVGAMVLGGVETGISVTYDDTNGRLDFAIDDEYIQDLIGAMVSGNTETNITVTYDDSGGKLNFVVSVGQEEVEDIVGAMVSGNTETGIAVTYDDTGGKLNFVVATLDQLPAPTGPLSLNSQRITSLADGVAATDAATVGQVQAAVAGLAPKDAVRAASTTNVNLATGLENGDTAGGVVLATGDRFGAFGQTTASENGIYVVQASGAAVRASDFDSEADVRGAIIPVEEGTNANFVFLLTTDAPITIGTTGLSFTVLFNPNTTAVQRFSQTIGDGVATSFVLTHNLPGGRDVDVVVKKAATPFDEWEADWEATSTTQVTVYFATAPATNEFRATVLG